MELHPTRRRTARRLAPLAALALACVLLAGCSATETSVGDRGSDNGGEPGQPLAPVEEDGGGASGGLDRDRQVISTASLSLSSNDPVDAADRAVQIVLDVDGLVDSRTDTPTDDHQGEYSQLVLRVPADDLDETMVELKTVGDLIRSSLNQTDVTTEVITIDARITALETSVDRLLSLMSQATTTADLITIESALSQRQTELDGLVAQRDALGDLVDYATVDMYITTPGEVAGAAPGDFWGGVVVGFQALVAFFGGLLVVLGVLLPWFILLGLLTLLVVWLVRRKKRAPQDSPDEGDWDGSPDGSIPPRPPLPPREHRAHVNDPRESTSPVGS